MVIFPKVLAMEEVLVASVPGVEAAEVESAVAFWVDPAAVALQMLSSFHRFSSPALFTKHSFNIYLICYE